jgi:DNA-binding GntR family transcriptional regulator
MRLTDGIEKRRTSADVVFEHIYDEIISLGLMPGAKISEAEIAERFGISRQPVRDAFTRLDNLQLIQIQPQRATQVKRFNMSGLAAARFIRLALEVEILKGAVAAWHDDAAAPFEENLAAQERAVEMLDRTGFHALDEAFHGLIAETAGTGFAFDLVLEKKAQVDRICVLSLKDAAGMEELVGDHRLIFDALRKRDAMAAEAALRLHLSRIERTIAKIHDKHLDYFDE